MRSNHLILCRPLLLLLSAFPSWRCNNVSIQKEKAKGGETQHYFVWSRAMCCAKSLGPLDCSPLGSSVRGVSQSSILAWAAISSSGKSSQLRDQAHSSCISCISGRFFTHWAIWEAPIVRNTPSQEPASGIFSQLWLKWSDLKMRLKCQRQTHIQSKAWTGKKPLHRSQIKPGGPHTQRGCELGSTRKMYLQTPGSAGKAVSEPNRATWVPHLLAHPVKEETEQAPFWKQDSIMGQTVNFEPHAQYLWKHTNWKTRPPEGRAPGLIPRLSAA